MVAPEAGDGVYFKLSHGTMLYLTYDGYVYVVVGDNHDDKVFYGDFHDMFRYVPYVYAMLEDFAW